MNVPKPIRNKVKDLLTSKGFPRVIFAMDPDLASVVATELPKYEVYKSRGTNAIEPMIKSAMKLFGYDPIYIGKKLQFYDRYGSK